MLRIARRVMLERGLLPAFSRSALAELATIDGPARDATARDRRHLLWASIDNDDSRDLDQLTVSAPGVNGNVAILVAIADVDALVKQGSALDEHARANTTSVYTAGEIFPMLPEKLSTNLTSLGAHEERLAIVVEMQVEPSGVVASSEIYRAVVINRAKLAYNSVAAWLDGTAPAPAPVAAVSGLDEQLRVQDRVAQTMKARRHQNGALSLESLEPRAVFDGETLSGLRFEARNQAKELIEDFMIAANSATARLLEAKQFPSLRRVLRSPDRWARIVELAATFEVALSAEPDARGLEAFLSARQRAEPATFPDLSLSVIKLLGRGEYVLMRPGEPAVGHFGLAVKDYTHSTAPNRRFPDVITQRLLKAALAGERPPYSEAELAELGRHCSEQEDAATHVERQVSKSAAALLLSTRLGARFSAIVTGASPKGTWVRINEPAIEGKLVRGFEGLDVGERISVQLLQTDVERGFIDFIRMQH